MTPAAAAEPAIAARTGLTAAERARFERDGYLAPLTALSPAEALALRRRLEPLLAPNGGLADARLRNKPHLVFAWVSDLVCHPRVLDAVASLIGPDLLVWRSVFFVKAPRDASHVAWHQDAAYWDLGGRAITAWIALTDSTTANGCVRVVPGSHCGALLDHHLGRDAHNRLLRGQVAAVDVSPEDVAPLELRAGEFSLHDSMLLHHSPPNPSADLRIGLAVRYIAPDARTAGPRQSARLVRGVDRHGHYDLEPAARTDHDPAALAAHSRSLRRYGMQALWQVLRRPTPSQLGLLVRMVARPDLLRAMLPARRRR